MDGGPANYKTSQYFYAKGESVVIDKDRLISDIRDELGDNAAVAFEHVIKFNTVADALRRYAHHDQDCASIGRGRLYCTCGLSDALDLIDA